jgi:NAD(P)-dependent dehydrogenase (short-subunit alcohol dehydrogenase family)
MADDHRLALIVGAGSGLSASIARAFAGAGMKIALAARGIDDLGALAAEVDAETFACDATKPDAVKRLFAHLDRDGGAPDVVVYNASYRTRGPLVDLDPAEVEKSLLVSAFGGFLVGQEATRRMLPRGSGTILFTGASASVKGYAQSAPFAMGKFALRGLAQSMARELGPQGIHVPMWWSTAASAARAAPTPPTAPMPCSTPTPSPRATCISCSSTAAPGPSNSKCGPGWRSFDGEMR